MILAERVRKGLRQLPSLVDFCLRLRLVFAVDRADRQRGVARQFARLLQGCVAQGCFLIKLIPDLIANQIELIAHFVSSGGV